jgi:hypothetical protein
MMMQHNSKKKKENYYCSRKMKEKVYKRKRNELVYNFPNNGNFAGSVNVCNVEDVVMKNIMCLNVLFATKDSQQNLK